jgi:hypothetical protein
MIRPSPFSDLSIITSELGCEVMTMEYELASSEEIQVLKKRLLNEVKNVYRTLNEDHSPVYRRLLETKSRLIGETLGNIAQNSNIRLDELVSFVEDRIETAEKEIDDAMTFNERENLFHMISAYEFIFGMVKKVWRKYRL